MEIRNIKFGSTRDLTTDCDRGEVYLVVRTDTEQLTCRVTHDALEALSAQIDTRDSDALLTIAYQHFELLTDKWMELICLGRREPDGSIVLHRHELR